MTYYAALDVGLRTTAVCIVDGNGEIQLEKSLPSEVDDIVTCLRGFGAQIAAVGLEAGTLTQWLTYGLRAADFRPVVVYLSARAPGWWTAAPRGEALSPVRWKVFRQPRGLQPHLHVMPGKPKI